MTDKYTVRVIGAIFGFFSSSILPTFIAAADYTQWIFTICWDLGFIALLFHQISCLAMVLRLRIPPYYNIARYTWGAIAIVLVIIAQAAQGSNITAGYAWTSHLVRGEKVTLAALPAIKGFLRIYIIFCIATVVLEIAAFSYALLSRKRRTGPLSTTERAQRNAFFGSMPFMGLYLVFACIRLWISKEPSHLYFGVFQVVPEAIVAWIYIALTCYTLRWDFWRACELDTIRKEMKHLWANALQDGIEYTKWAQAGGASGVNRRVKPWIVLLAEMRFGVPADHYANPEKGEENMLDTLALLAQFADIITSNLVLELRPMMPLRKRDESRKPDISETEIVVTRLLVEKFKPMAEATAERLAREWTPCFAQDPTKLGPDMIERVREARKSSVMAMVMEV
jgi:hypothetical protein